MPFNAIQSYFFTPTVLNRYRIGKQDFHLLAGLLLVDGSFNGISKNKLRIYCVEHGFLNDYRNFKRVVEPLISKGFILYENKRVRLSNDGILLLNKVERNLKKAAA